tara:strand:- start:473 stop:649 length:177 start_codon:yes stop_codon:yes gene_type:complete
MILQSNNIEEVKSTQELLTELVEREKFFKWLNTCPAKWLIVEDEFGWTNIDFFYEEEE